MQQEKLVLLIDDAHYMDSYSFALLCNLMEDQHMTNFVAVMSTNHLVKDCGSNLLEDALPEGERFIWHNLQHLEAQHVNQLVCRELGVESLPDRLVPVVLDVVQVGTLTIHYGARNVRYGARTIIEYGAHSIHCGAVSYTHLTLPTILLV
eukprot:942979-Pyramimonas_sp.AAC.1